MVARVIVENIDVETVLVLSGPTLSQCNDRGSLN